MIAWRRMRRLAAIGALLVLAAAAVSIARGYPSEVADPILGDAWRCSRIVVLTSCTRVVPSGGSEPPTRSPITIARELLAKRAAACLFWREMPPRLRIMHA
jgi:hypothetical protein